MQCMAKGKKKYLNPRIPLLELSSNCFAFWDNFALIYENHPNLRKIFIVEKGNPIITFCFYFFLYNAYIEILIKIKDRREAP